MTREEYLALLRLLENPPEVQAEWEPEKAAAHYIYYSSFRRRSWQ